MPFSLPLAVDSAGASVETTVILLVVASLVSILASRLHIPYTIALVVMGLALGMSNALPGVTLSRDVILLVFVPPLLFEGTLAMNWAMLTRDWREISILAIGVTAGCFVGIATVAHYGLGFSWPISFLLGAILSPTDPVSVLAIMREVRAPRRLSLLLEAESCFNDGIGAVLFLIVAQMVQGEEIGVGSTVVLFVRESVGGLLAGAVVAYGACHLLRKVDDHLTEIMVSLAVAYGSYVVAEHFGVSGIMAVIAAGLVVGNFGVPHAVSDDARAILGDVWEVLAFIANSMLFLLIGASLQRAHVGEVAKPAAVLFLSLLLLRHGLVMAGLRGKVPTAWLHGLAWGGIRGSIPIALALSLPQLPERGALVSIVFAVVLFSLLLQGTTIGPVLRRLGLRETAPADV